MDKGLLASRAILLEERVGFAVAEPERNGVMILIRALKDIDYRDRKPHRTARLWTFVVTVIFFATALIAGTLSGLTRMEILFATCLVALAVYLAVWIAARPGASYAVRNDCVQLNDMIRNSQTLKRAVRHIRESEIEPILLERFEKRIPQLAEGGIT
jgi:hypothetical protein